MKGEKRIGILKTLMALAIVFALSHIVSAITMDKRIEYKKTTFQSPRLPKEMNGYLLAFISDTHSMTAQDLHDVVRELNKIQPDLLVLGGDFPSTPGAADRTMEILSQVAATDGIFGVEGNHDNYIVLFSAMEKYSVQPLTNSGTYIRDHFFLAGVEDLWNRNPNISVATEESSADDFVLLITHNPDISMIQDTTSVDLILCGHTHGGHITLFGVFAPALALRNTITDYGQRFMSGWAQSRDGVPVYVSNGAGTFIEVPRVFARPQVILMTLGCV